MGENEFEFIDDFYGWILKKVKKVSKKLQKIRKMNPKDEYFLVTPKRKKQALI